MIPFLQVSPPKSCMLTAQFVLFDDRLKNWSGRNEIIATSGRPHPSRPQNKRLYTPWTTDYRHTRRDRWIQTELAFTPAKNATKPDPVDMISLQTTRKENNWKTEETLARTVVTLETERIRLVQSLMYMMMMMMMMMMTVFVSSFERQFCSHLRVALRQSKKIQFPVYMNNNVQDSTKLYS